MTWLVREEIDFHPVVAIALGDADEVVVRMPIAVGSATDGATLLELQLDIEPGFSVLAIRRGGRYLYRPRGFVRLFAGDELIATGPDEGVAAWPSWPVGVCVTMRTPTWATGSCRWVRRRPGRAQRRSGGHPVEAAAQLK